MISYSHQVQRSELYLVAITCIQHVFRSPLSCLCSAYLSFYFLILNIFSFKRNQRMVVESKIKPCFVLLGIHLQSLHLSNLQQIFRRYGGKMTFSPFTCCLVRVSIILNNLLIRGDGVKICPLSITY